MWIFICFFRVRGIEFSRTRYAREGELLNYLKSKNYVFTGKTTEN